MIISSKDNPPLVGMRILYMHASQSGKIVELTEKIIYYKNGTVVYNTTFGYWNEGHYEILEMPANYKIPKAIKKSRLSFI